MAQVSQLLTDLQTAAKQYVAEERKRLTNEASALNSILDKRTAGRGLQRVGTQVVAAAAQQRLQDYISGL